MKPEVEVLVRQAFDDLKGHELMTICKFGAKLAKESSTPYEELKDVEQAAIHVLQIVLVYLEELGVIEDVPVLH